MNLLTCTCHVYTMQDDARLVAIREDPSLGNVFVQALFGPLYEVFNSMAGPAIRNKCMKTILKILYHTEYVMILHACL